MNCQINLILNQCFAAGSHSSLCMRNPEAKFTSHQNHSLKLYIYMYTHTQNRSYLSVSSNSMISYWIIVIQVKGQSFSHLLANCGDRDNLTMMIKTLTKGKRVGVRRKVWVLELRAGSTCNIAHDACTLPQIRCCYLTNPHGVNTKIRWDCKK